MHLFWKKKYIIIKLKNAKNINIKNLDKIKSKTLIVWSSLPEISSNFYGLGWKIRLVIDPLWFLNSCVYVPFLVSNTLIPPITAPVAKNLPVFSKHIWLMK